MREYTPVEKRKIRLGLCFTPFCRKKPKRGHICSTCARRKWAEKHPEKYAFCNLRGNARRRDKDFTLTFEQFKTKIEGTEYMENRGRTKLCWSIDRFWNEHGYHDWNVRVVTVSYNSTKRNYIDYPKNEETAPF